MTWLRSDNSRTGGFSRASARKLFTIRPARSAAHGCARPLPNVSCGRLLPQQGGLRHQDRQRVVQLMGHAGQQRAHGGELFDLGNAGALRLDFRLGALALAQVAHMGCEQMLVRQANLVEGHLDRIRSPSIASASSCMRLPMTRETPVAM